MKRFAFAFAILACCVAASAQDKPAGPRITGIDHVVIYVSNLNSARDFYTAKVGLTPGGSGCRETKRACFTVNWASTQHIELEPSDSCPRNDCLSEIVFATGDARKLRSNLARKGIKVTPVSKIGYRYLQFESEDPEGNRIGFVQTVGWPIDDLPPGVHNGPNLIHAGLVVHDRDAEDRFYKDVLGFHVYWHGGMKDGEDNWVDMQVPDGTDWIEYMLGVSPNASHKTLGVMNHIALGVPDIHSAEQQLIKNGWKPTEEPKIGRDGKWQLNLYDPDETRVELMEFKPTKEPCCSPYTGPHPGPKQ